MLRLIPRPRSVETAYAGVASPEAALDLLGLASERTAGAVTSFELMARAGIDIVLRHAAGMRDPLPEKHPWCVLIELSSQSRAGLRDVLEEILGAGLERGLIVDATIADNLEQAKMFWRMEKGEGFSRLLWDFAGGKPKVNRFRSTAQVPAETAVSRRISRELASRGFKFCGPTIVYAFMRRTLLEQVLRSRGPNLARA